MSLVSPYHRRAVRYSQQGNAAHLAACLAVRRDMGVACELIGRRWIGCDIDPVALATSQSRLAGAEIPYAMPLFTQEADAC